MHPAGQQRARPQHRQPEEASGNCAQGSGFNQVQAGGVQRWGRPQWAGERTKSKVQPRDAKDRGGTEGRAKKLRSSLKRHQPGAFFDADVSVFSGQLRAWRSAPAHMLAAAEAGARCSR